MVKLEKIEDSKVLNFDRLTRVSLIEGEIMSRGTDRTTDLKSDILYYYNIPTEFIGNGIIKVIS